MQPQLNVVHECGLFLAILGGFHGYQQHQSELTYLTPISLQGAGLRAVLGASQKGANMP